MRWIKRAIGKRRIRNCRKALEKQSIYKKNLSSKELEAFSAELKKMPCIEKARALARQWTYSVDYIVREWRKAEIEIEDLQRAELWALFMAAAIFSGSYSEDEIECAMYLYLEKLLSSGMKAGETIIFRDTALDVVTEYEKELSDVLKTGDWGWTDQFFKLMVTKGIPGKSRRMMEVDAAEKELEAADQNEADILHKTKIIRQKREAMSCCYIEAIEGYNAQRILMEEISEYWDIP